MLYRFIALCWLVWAQALMAAPTADLPREPVLRIETGSHLSAITHISSDAQGRYAVTSSEDKTARLWDLRSGKALSVLRPPLGAENIGALYAVAMSPDGQQIATGGNAAFDGQSHALYLFDRAKASLPPKSTLSGLEAPITELAWSADSQLIAVGLRQTGLRVFQRQLGFIGADPEFNEAIYGAAFARDGRLAVVSLDGAVRLYRFGPQGLERIARKQMPGRPYALAWSPDNQLLAIGMHDSAQVAIVSPHTLEVLYTIELPGAGNLAKVAWSPDGQTLFAGGSLSRQGRFPVFAFAQAGRAAGREVAHFGNIVTSLAANETGLLASSAQPAWSALDAAGEQRFSVTASMADFRDALDAFRLSADAQQLALPTQMGGKAGVWFDFALGELRLGDAPPQLMPAQVPAGLSDWRNAPAPQWRGRVLPLRQGERSRSAAGLPDGRFVLGTDWFLRSYSAAGALLWEQRTPATVWAANISADGRWAVAALGDGSVRWYRLADGREQLALFIHSDRERWIAWTPSGYYDTSIGGEALVGWHVNRAFNQAADFFSVGRFRERFYAPSVVAKVLQLGDEQQALLAYKTTPLAQKNTAPVAAPLKTTAVKVTEMLPPLVELQSDHSIDSNDAIIPIRYTVRTPDNAPLQDLKIRVNGQLKLGVKQRILRSAAGNVFELEVPVPPKNSEILLIAENKYAKSDPISIQVRRPSTDPGKAAYVEKYDTLYMLVVAVNKYPGKNALELPVKDAKDFQHQLAHIANPPAGRPKLYNKSEVKVLFDQDASLENIRAGLKWLKDNVKAKDAGIFFLAGHGLSDERSYYYVPHRANDIGKKEQWLSGFDIVETLQSLPGRAIFFLDTCHAGALANQAKVVSTINQVEDEKGVIVFASSTAKELSQEKDDWGNGAFTKALIEGLRGEAEDPRDKMVYPTTLKRYVTRRVRELTDNEQRPYISDHGIDDPIAIVVK